MRKVKMDKKIHWMLAAVALSGGAFAENLFPGGTFTETRSLSEVGLANGGAIALHTENGSWNRCVRLSVARAYTNEQGFVTFMANGWFGSDGKTVGIPVQGDTLYDFALEIKGDGNAKQVAIGFQDWQTGPWTKDSRKGNTTVGRVALSDGWTRFRGSFRTHPDARRAVLTVSLWQSTEYPPVTLEVGDRVFVDNVTVEASPYVRENLTGSRFVAAPVAVDSDYAIPFLPRELFHAPSNVVLKAAVNECVDLPIAVANLTDRAADYRVVLETVPTNKFNLFYTGDYGLRGLEPSRVVARGAVRMKDTTRAPASVRLDPLPRLNEAQTITVSPGEAGLVWFDIDLKDARPGTYRGRVRVIPLGEPGDWVSVVGYGNRTYVGPLQDIAVTLEVRPIVLDKAAAIPSAFFQHPASEREMGIFTQLGVTEYQVSPWSVGYAQDKDGNLDLNRPTDGQRRAVAQMRRERAWAAARGVKATYFIGFSCFDTMNYVYNAKKSATDAAARRLWPQFLRGLKKMMNEAGVADGEYNVETFDEPDPKRFDELIWAHETARQVVPGVKLTLTLGAHTLSAEEMRRLDPVTDSWILWTHGYFRREDHLSYIADALRRGKRVWHYQCNTSPRVPIFEGYRQHAWFGEAHRLSGNQFFLLHDAQGGVGERDWKAPTEGGFVYRSFDDFIPSVRYMSFRRGVNDVKYLAKLRAVAGDRPDVQAFLRTAAKRVVETGRLDRTAADRVREEAAALILKWTPRDRVPR